MAVEEGGGAQGMKNAVNWALTCLEMGYPHYKYCPRTRSARFLYVEEGFKESMVQKWERRREQRTENANPLVQAATLEIGIEMLVHGFRGPQGYQGPRGSLSSASQQFEFNK
eukprot:2864203-Pyramimonas_sp.AAC.1